ncbi:MULTISPECIES: hypothetical protein [Nostocales]|uniref:hypothetical protein n=1 Tax=Nostocales TaxID=1161 RepID=UPI0005EAB708|nr:MULTISPECIES: hypothetical protein [Nostocales]BAY95171.1 hypothetical protein NIES3275_72280 [Microchaete diplosiphon NIES-3275]EKE97894.1 hypothetical protein FDUTEX481_04462 [Tolypothrix sp. PCC 7601]MBE9080723.1 hypothetical protein [Tolypothrix sp. LEGE 11397]UYD30326.1 hypothetical protein HGR01_36505 [Tolypothrix sp. PCC 7712]UYD38231.1 hypothetical protein HG267_36745 [Tolypothrix sp. PCC 7601]
MLEYLLLKRVSICKLMLLALMWIQFDEDSQNQLTPDYSSPLQVENLIWLGETSVGEEVEHFCDVYNTARIGVWEEILELKLVDLIADLPTCLHDASWFALLAITMMLVDKELDGICVHSQDEFFARTIALESLADLSNSYLAKGHPYLDFPLSLEDAKSLLPVNRKQELEIKLEKFLIDTYEHDFDDEAPDISEFSSIYLKDILKEFFVESDWQDDINQEAVAQLQEKYGLQYSEGAFSPETKEHERWGKTLVFLKQFIGLDSNFIESQSDLFLDESQAADLPDYFRIKTRLERWQDRTVVLSRLVHTLVHFLLVGQNYHPSHIQDLMAIPVSSRAISSLQACLGVAAYRSGYYMAASNIPESEIGRNWLLQKAFPNLLEFYQTGQLSGKQ